MNFYLIYVCEDDAIRIEPDWAGGDKSPLGEEWDDGRIINFPAQLKFKTYLKNQKAHDWVGGYSWIPYVSQRVKDRLEPQLGAAVQWHGPIPCKKKLYYMLNCVKSVDCLLPNSNSNQLFFNEQVVSNELIFRPKGFSRKLIATDQLKSSITEAGDSGIRFGMIQSDGWVEPPMI
jgi:hypothetical protein